MHLIGHSLLRQRHHVDTAKRALAAQKVANAIAVQVTGRRGSFRKSSARVSANIGNRPRPASQDRPIAVHKQDSNSVTVALPDKQIGDAVAVDIGLTNGVNLLAKVVIVGRERQRRVKVAVSFGDLGHRLHGVDRVDRAG